MTQQLCKRTWALWRNSEPLEGFYCSFAWSGRIPCTGTLKCLYCGSHKDEMRSTPPQKWTPETARQRVGGTFGS